MPALAEQIDIKGPPGSSVFGLHVAALPNGNFVVTDPDYSTQAAPHVGAVYLYAPDATVISTLLGSSENDRVGANPIVVLANGNFVVSTLYWDNGGVRDAGAVTWISATTGLSGVVSADNSLVGSSEDDEAGGYNGVVALTNGNYVVSSRSYSGASAANVGAITWGNGASGTSGIISSENSLFGTEPGDLVGLDQTTSPGIVALPNGNYVVISAVWHWSTAPNAGAVTFGDGAHGTVGPVSPTNSLVGTRQCYTDVFGLDHQAIALTNGNYVVVSPCFSVGDAEEVGAVTWGDGTHGTSGEISVRNSLLGATAGEHLGVSRVTPLANGNYVVLDPFWSETRGAAMWVNGATGRSGHISAGNSLTGRTAGDAVGSAATGLSNGDYVVSSARWSSASAANVGAATWASGVAGLRGKVSEANSLIGAASGDFVSSGGITALTNGNYVVTSPYWNNGVSTQAGAATWARGEAPTSGVVTSSNSIVGTGANDTVTGRGVIALANGNYVVASPAWSNGAVAKVGAVTWASGDHVTSMAVASENSLIGTHASDAIGSDGVTALVNGNYVVASSAWHDIDGNSVSAITWSEGSTGRTGPVSPANSLVGTTSYYGSRVAAFSDANYVVTNRFSLFGELAASASMSLGDGWHGLTGPIAPWNSVIGVPTGYGFDMVAAYDSARQRLVVGRPAENIVTLFSVNEEIFASNFEQLPTSVDATSRAAAP